MKKQQQKEAKSIKTHKKLVLHKTNPKKNLFKKEIHKADKEVRKLEQGVVKTIKLGDTAKQVEKIENNVFRRISAPFIQDRRKQLTLGQRTSDLLTKWAGSWIFIILFFLFLALWMAVNGYFLIQYQKEVFDPYPFILLNLVLSCLAAIQAPVILMSQNRQSERDRMRAEYDYQVNRKAEREIKEIIKQLDRIERKLGLK